MRNSINWFSIPAEDFDRACKFYAEILDGDVRVTEFGKEKMGMLPNFDMKSNGVGGHITYDPKNVSEKGTMVFLDGGKDLQIMLDRVEPAGGKIILSKTASAGGHMAIFFDTEGNRLAIHSL